MRFDIILYTRACNAVRDYFKMRASETEVATFSQYLKLPTDKFVPPYFDGFVPFLQCRIAVMKPACRGCLVHPSDKVDTTGLWLVDWHKAGLFRGSEVQVSPLVGD